MTGVIARLRARLTKGERDRGSISLFVVTAMVAVLAVLALVADGAGKLSALNHAQATAQEAARIGADSVSAGAAISGDGITVDRGAAQRAATAYLAQAGVTGSVSFDNTGSIVVDTTQTYTPVLLPLGGGAVTGHASAKLIVQGG
ncbi:pilus assembly protein TadG-related protein [Kitasatospora kifunensis]|uniref:Putative Flp pilus-assembly TadG-like N-terminal domain-containing protein n=1 Tax=Kitasatospora kifunensis TaxID=58351 RepID=A0A7W7RAC2_KITKI|nr:hypothetical protein [Kitasatospora kifunensis]MBB4928264.1 hypothetical protein [Kitasatospora kifunensis]